MPSLQYRTAHYEDKRWSQDRLIFIMVIRIFETWRTNIDRPLNYLMSFHTSLIFCGPAMKAMWLYVTTGSGPADNIYNSFKASTESWRFFRWITHLSVQQRTNHGMKIHWISTELYWKWNIHDVFWIPESNHIYQQKGLLVKKGMIWYMFVIS